MRCDRMLLMEGGINMQLPFEWPKAVAGEACTEIAQPAQQVFEFIGAGFFENYPKWDADVAALEPINGDVIESGVTAKQTRYDNGTLVESIFKVTEFEPDCCLVLQGVNAPYKQSYLLQAQTETVTNLTFRFELLELEVFMRPFEKLIRYAIQEGAENTVQNIKQLLCNEAALSASAVI